MAHLPLQISEVVEKCGCGLFQLTAFSILTLPTSTASALSNIYYCHDTVTETCSVSHLLASISARRLQRGR